MPLLHPGSWDSVYLTREVVTLEIFRQLIIICDGLSERRQNNWGSDLFHIEDLESDIVQAHGEGQTCQQGVAPPSSKHLGSMTCLTAITSYQKITLLPKTRKQ